MITAKDATIKYSESGINKVNMPIGRMLVLSIMAGMFISLAGTASSIVAATVDNHSIARMLMALVFPAGLAMVVLNNSELFTGNNLLVISLLDKRISFLSMIKNWVVVYIGNLLGSMLVTGIITIGHVYSSFDNAMTTRVINIAVTKASLGTSDAFTRGILCNVLVCVAVMMTLMAETAGGKIAALYFPIFVFVVCGFEHSVANMGYISGGIFANMKYGNCGVDVSSLTWYRFFVGNLLPVTLGNILGGCMTGAAYWFISRKDK